MNAYIDTHAHGGTGFRCYVVTSQDYNERGPHSHSYCSPTCASRETAERKAAAWAAEHGLAITNVSHPDFL